MNEEYFKYLFTFSGILVGSGITILTVVLNNKNQRKIEKTKSQSQLEHEQIKKKAEEKSKYLDRISIVFEEAIQILGEIEFSNSLTKSVMDSSQKLSQEKIDENHKELNRKIRYFESKTLIFFPKINIQELLNLTNRNWGEQRLLMIMNYKMDRQGYIDLQSKIIEISNSTNSEIEKIKNDLISFLKQEFKG